MWFFLGLNLNFQEHTGNFVFAREKTNSFKESSLVFFKERQVISMYVAVVSMSASELLHTLVPLP